MAVAWPTQGTGIEDNPFIISSTDDWNGFANFVNGDYTFSGQFVKLSSNISVSNMAGSNDAKSFQGTFDGADLHQRHVRRAIRRRILRPVPPREERHD